MYLKRQTCKQLSATTQALMLKSPVQMKSVRLLGIRSHSHAAVGRCSMRYRLALPLLFTLLQCFSTRLPCFSMLYLIGLYYIIFYMSFSAIRFGNPASKGCKGTVGLQSWHDERLQAPVREESTPNQSHTDLPAKLEKIKSMLLVSPGGNTAHCQYVSEFILLRSLGG